MIVFRNFKEKQYKFLRQWMGEGMDGRGGLDCYVIICSIVQPVCTEVGIYKRKKGNI